MEDRPPDAPIPPAPYVASPPGPPPGSPPGPPPAGAAFPFEEPGRGFVSGFFATVKLIYSKPRQAFERMPLTSDVLRPYLFALIAGWIGIAGGVFWQTVFGSLMSSMRSMAGMGGDDTRFLMPMLMGPLALVWAPFAIAIGVLVGSLITHLFLMLLGAAKSGFVATLRVLCYAQAATLLHLFPACGSLVGGIVGIVFTIIGLSAVHRVGNGRAAAAVLLPGVLCCVLVIWMVMLLGGAAFLSHFHPDMHP